MNKTFIILLAVAGVAMTFACLIGGLFNATPEQYTVLYIIILVILFWIFRKLL